jgi:hypothetical protein
MEDNTTPSADGDQASTSGLPQAGTTTTDGQAPVSQSTSTEHERIIAELRKENAASRKKLSAYEETEKASQAAKRAAEEAQLSEIERTKKQLADLQSQHETYVRQTQERLVRHAVERQATQLGIIDPDAATKLLDWSELEFDDNNLPTNAEKLLEKLIKNKPWLKPAPTEQKQEPTVQPPKANPAIPAFNPGRTNVAAPNSNPPGYIPSLTDVFRRQ